VSLADKLQRQHLAALTPYASARRSMSGGNIWLNANESPYAPDDDNAGTDQALNLNRYPAFQDTDLRAAYAKYAEVAATQVLIGRGSDEAIDVLIRTFCEPQQDRIMICPPTYGMYAISAQTQGAEVVSVPLLNDTDESPWQLDIEGIKSQLDGVKIVFICNPSNPLGNAVNTDAIKAVLAAVGDRALVVVDEAYIEYGTLEGVPSVAKWLEQYPQLVVLRTLSKAFGLAGIRCGFALANADIITTMQKVLAPYPLPAPTVAIAKRALSTPALTQMQAQLAATQQQRDILVKTLTQLQQQPDAYIKRIFPSVTNFVLFQVEDASALVTYCQQHGVLIRNQSAQLGLPDSVRISIGNAEENQAVITLLEAYMKDRNS